MPRDANQILMEHGVDGLRDAWDEAHADAKAANGNGAHVGDDVRPPAFTDEALALRFAELHADDLRYVATWSQWLTYVGCRWKPDETLKAFDYARRICRQAAAACNTPKTASAIASAKTVAAIVSLARADRRLAATKDQWDADPWALNTPGGMVDLRTGNMCPHNRLDYATKIAAIAPSVPGEAHPHWTAFLNRVMGDNAELIAFLQRLFGYALTGLTDEHAFVFAHGGGANGKSTMLKAIAAILRDYATTASTETFIETRIERHPTDVAKLVGARLVTAQETQKGRRWDETKIKALTGGDTITTRRMRQDFFDFTPTFKLLIAGNHKPRLANVDEAIRRRFILLPFEITIPEGERDPDLPRKLESEYPAILRWAMDGCLQWQAHRLSVPAAIRNATDAYMADQDVIGQWIEECVNVDAGPYAIALTADLFRSWKAWCEARNIPPGTERSLSEALQSRGIDKTLHGTTRRAGYRVQLRELTQ